MTWIDFFLFFSSYDSHFGCVVVLIVIEFSIDDGDFGYESGDPGDCVNDFAGDYVSDFEYGYGDVAVIYNFNKLDVLNILRLIMYPEFQRIFKSFK